MPSASPSRRCASCRSRSTPIATCPPRWHVRRSRREPLRKERRIRDVDEKVIILPLFVVAMTLGTIACDADDRRAAKLAPVSAPASRQIQVTRDAREEKMKITIGAKTFKATLEDNPTASK